LVVQLGFFPAIPTPFHQLGFFSSFPLLAILESF